MGLAIFLSRSFSRPLNALVDRSNRIKDLDLMSGQGVASGFIEIEQLSGSLEDMRRALEEHIGEREKAEEETHRLNEGLEQIVEERTSELQHANEELSDATQQAEEANQSKSAFLANMSHEIRTPMNAILGFSDILAGLETEPQKRQYLDSVRTSGKSLLGLINDILDLSKVEAGKLELQYAPADVRALCMELEQIFTQKTSEAGIELIIDADGLPEGAIIDELRVRQILVNLTSNAIKFTESGHVRIIGSSEETPLGMTLRFAVEDTGIGIPQDQQDKIFGAFEQTAGQSTAKFGGTGLGLAISKRLAQMMNGDITLTSRVDDGSTFTLELRDMTVVSSEELAEVGNVDSEVARVVFEPAKVLVVDDVDYNRLLVKTYLTGCGLELIEAVDGDVALKKCAEERPDVVLMDLRMPGMSGIEATEALKADTELSSIVVVAHTASAMKEDEEKNREIFDGFLVKPASKTDVVRELMRHLPHELRDEAEAPPSAAPAEWSQDSLTSEQRSGLNALAGALEVELDRCAEFSQTQSIDEIEVFASQMQELSNQYGYPPLGDWGERLALEASLFDIPSMSQTLEEFGSLVEQVRSVGEEGL